MILNCTINSVAVRQHILLRQVAQSNVLNPEMAEDLRRGVVMMFVVCTRVDSHGRRDAKKLRYFPFFTRRFQRGEISPR